MRDVLPDAPFFPNRNHDLVRRSAILLSWAAEVRPGTLVPYAEITQRVLRLNTQLTSDDPLTLVVKDHVQRCGPALLREFARDLVFTNVGARATVSAEELFLQLGKDLDHALESVEECERRIRLIRRQDDMDWEIRYHLFLASNTLKRAGRPMREALSDWSLLAGERAGLIARVPDDDDDDDDGDDDADDATSDGTDDGDDESDDRQATASA